MPLGVVRTKSRSIWDDINPFIENLVAAYKQSQQTKWDNEWQLSAITDIEKANKSQEVTDLLELQKQPKDFLDLEGFTGFVKDSMGLLAMKEMEMHPEDFTKKGIQPTEGVAKTQTMPDVKEFNELYKFVSELPTGKVDWTNTMNLFKQKLESGRAMGSAAQQFLSMIMGQSMPTDQRQKVEQDVGFAKELQGVLFPKEKAPSSDYERWEKDPEKFAAFKQVGREQEQIFDWEKFLKETPDWQIKSINSKGDVIVGRKDTTKKWDFDTWKEAQQWTSAHPQAGFDWKIDPQPEGFNVTAIKKTVTPEGTKKLIPTFQTINAINNDLGDPGKDYDTVMHNAQIKYNLEGVKLVSKVDQARNAYDTFERIIIGEEYIDEKGIVKEEEAYTDYYNDYEKYAKQYFDETGEILPKKYLSIAEAGIYEKIQWKGGVAKGDLKPILNIESIPWSWQTKIDPTQALYNEMQRTGTKPEDYDLEELARDKGIDIDRLMKIISER